MSNLPNIPHSEDDNFHFESELRSRGFSRIGGIDEVGRGPLAGPVVAACVCLPATCDPSPFFDSKKTTLKQRLSLFGLLHEIGATMGIGVVSHKRIDSINILQASLLAMKLAVYCHSKVHAEVDFMLVDGKFEIPLDTPQLALVKGESRSGSIAAASIVAKLYRDTVMAGLDRRFPLYNFKKNMGYPTKQHRDALVKYGPCPFHRTSFKGVRELVV